MEFSLWYIYNYRPGIKCRSVVCAIIVHVIILYEGEKTGILHDVSLIELTILYLYVPYYIPSLASRPDVHLRKDRLVTIAAIPWTAPECWRHQSDCLISFSNVKVTWFQLAQYSRSTFARRYKACVLR